MSLQLPYQNMPEALLAIHLAICAFLQAVFSAAARSYIAMPLTSEGLDASGPV